MIMFPRRCPHLRTPRPHGLPSRQRNHPSIHQRHREHSLIPVRAIASLPHSSPTPPSASPPFDTHRVALQLETRAGLSLAASEAVTLSLAQVVAQSIHAHTHNAIPKSDFERVVYATKADLNQLKSGISLVEQNEYMILKTEIARLASEVDRIALRSAEEFRRIQTSARLDLSAEKSRVRDEHNDQAIHLKEADAKIESELASVKTLLEGIQWELFKTLFPLFSAAFALIFSYLRFVR
ncbi:hypothetical protein BC830DRAFT_1126645 [Chytriomyces sp. MP71]|nr:hypothetical protein BC830DRAFT_1126645 [Chytriomyces sp. MP71]